MLQLSRLVSLIARIYSTNAQSLILFNTEKKNCHNVSQCKAKVSVTVIPCYSVIYIVHCKRQCSQHNIHKEHMHKKTANMPKIFTMYAQAA